MWCLRPETRAVHSIIRGAVGDFIVFASICTPALHATASQPRSRPILYCCRPRPCPSVVQSASTRAELTGAGLPLVAQRVPRHPPGRQRRRPPHQVQDSWSCAARYARPPRPALRSLTGVHDPQRIPTPPILSTRPSTSSAQTRYSVTLRSRARQIVSSSSSSSMCRTALRSWGRHVARRRSLRPERC